MRIYCSKCDIFLADIEESVNPLPKDLKNITYFAVCPKCGNQSYKCETTKCCRFTPRDGFFIKDCQLNNNEMVYELGVQDE